MTTPPLSTILLAGGFGTRVRALYPDLPKPMIPSHGRPFLEWVLRYWRTRGATHAVVSLGHLANVAERYLAARLPEPGFTVQTVCEPRPMGTGGAIRWAVAHYHGAAATLSDPFFVANADSLALARLAPALERLAADPALDAVLLGVEVPDASRYGSLLVDPQSGLLTGFAEKRTGAARQPGLINAGVYLLRQALVERFPPDEPLSLESQVFPALLAAGARLAVVGSQAPFLDMGTPEALVELDGFIAAHFPLDV